LLGGLNRFIEFTLQDNVANTGTASLENTVLNFSLTIRSVPKEGEEPIPPEIANAIQEITQMAGSATEGPAALQTPLEIVRSLGGTVVAAAGNDSAEEPQSTPEPSGLPASFTGIIGVEASNQARERSCYSNSGILRAPGGEGGPPLAGTPTPEAGGESANCTPLHNTCDPTSASCEYGVISTTYRVHEGFAYWVGTSFATPLVTGLVALELESGTSPTNMAAEIAVQNGVVDVLGSVGP
jgi:subtilisin family serine protease